MPLCLLSALSALPILRAMPTPIPTPAQLKDYLRTNCLTRQQAADICEVSLYTVHGWCAPEGNTSSRSMPAPAWKLLRLYATPAGRAALQAIETGTNPA